MKKLRVLIVLIVIFVMFTSISFARPGGGGHGGGSSSSSGGHSSSRGHASSYNYNSKESSNPIENAILFIFMIIAIKSNSIICCIKAVKKQKQCKVALVDLSKYDQNWNLKKINKDIKKAFYIMSDAWTNMNQDIAIDYSTEKLYENHKTQLEWMKVKGERNVLRIPKLLSHKIIGIDNTNKENIGEIWVYIRGFMIDYIEVDRNITKGNRYIPTSYVEYWKFKNENGIWKLDEIRQRGNSKTLDEINIKIVKIYRH